MTGQRPDPKAPRTARESYLRWEERFSIADYLFGQEPNAYLVSKAPLFAPGGRALSVADGEGRNSVWLAEQGLQVDAFDFSPTAVKKAERLARERGAKVNFNVSDMFAWNWMEASYDLVAAVFIQFATPAERAKLFPLMRRALKPGGLLVLQGYRLDQLEFGTGGPKQPEHLYTEGLVREALAGMELIELLSYEEALDEGTGHAGMSALLGAVARKPA